MAYSASGFSFKPSTNFSFSPNGQYDKNGRTNDSPIKITDNKYVPSCKNNPYIRDIQHRQVSELTNTAGMTITYLPVKYNSAKANSVYGEDAVSGFHYGRQMKAIINKAGYTVGLNQFGYIGNVDLTIYIPIREFIKVWGPPNDEEGLYPLAGDIFYINEEACDRPLGQSPQIYEVTDKDDSESPVDMLMGHYVWKLDCIKSDYTYQPGHPEERFLDSGITDSSPFGRLPGGDNPPDLSDRDYDVDVEAAKDFKQSKNKNNTYGGY